MQLVGNKNERPPQRGVYGGLGALPGTAVGGGAYASVVPTNQ